MCNSHKPVRTSEAGHSRICLQAGCDESKWWIVIQFYVQYMISYHIGFYVNTAAPWMHDYKLLRSKLVVTFPISKGNELRLSTPPSSWCLRIQWCHPYLEQSPSQPRSHRSFSSLKLSQAYLLRAYQRGRQTRQTLELRQQLTLLQIRKQMGQWFVNQTLRRAFHCSDSCDCVHKYFHPLLCAPSWHESEHAGHIPAMGLPLTWHMNLRLYNLRSKDNEIGVMLHYPPSICFQ